jgi:hypothetical protein
MFVALAACTPGARAPARVDPPAAAAPVFARVTDEVPGPIEVAPLVPTAVARLSRLRGAPIATPTVEVLSDDAFYERVHPLVEASFRVKEWTATRHHILNEFVAFASADGKTLWVRGRVDGPTWAESDVLARLGAAIMVTQLPGGPPRETTLEKMTIEAIRRGFARFYGAAVAKLAFLPPQRALLDIATRDGELPSGSEDRNYFGDTNLKKFGLSLEEVRIWEEAGFRLAIDAYGGGGNALVDQVLRDPPQTFREASGLNPWNYAGNELEVEPSPPGYRIERVVAPWLQLQLTDAAESTFATAGDIWGTAEITEEKSGLQAFVFSVRKSDRSSIEEHLREAGAVVKDGPGESLIFAAGGQPALEMLDRVPTKSFFVPGTYRARFKRPFLTPNRPSARAYCDAALRDEKDVKQTLTSVCFATDDLDEGVTGMQFTAESIVASMADIRRNLTRTTPFELLERPVPHLPAGSRAITFRVAGSAPANPLFTFLVTPICDGGAGVIVVHKAEGPTLSATAASDAFLAAPPKVSLETVCRLVASERARDLPAPVTPPDVELLH